MGDFTEVLEHNYDGSTRLQVTYFATTKLSHYEKFNEFGDCIESWDEYDDPYKNY